VLSRRYIARPVDLQHRASPIAGPKSQMGHNEKQRSGANAAPEGRKFDTLWSTEFRMLDMMLVAHFQ